jgi:hypothetical protein
MSPLSKAIHRVVGASILAEDVLLELFGENA